MKTVVAVGAGILTALGDLDDTWAGLTNGQSGLVLRKIDGFDNEWPIGLIDGLPETLGTNKRLDALFDRLFQNLPDLPENTTLLCATTKGAVDELLEQGDHDFGQPWRIARQLTERLSITGEFATVSAACASGTIAIIQGAMRIAAGECENVLVVGVDLVSRFVLSGFISLKVLSTDGCKPFDVRRDGLSLGEGAGWILLSSVESSRQSPWSLTAQLAGWGIAGDASHITAPCRRASGLIATLKQVIHRSKVPIGGINAHGTGTIYNDAMELLAFKKVLDAPVPICSIKGSIGHCLGASGVIETVLSLKSLKNNILPPTVGLVEPADDTMLLSGDTSLHLGYPTVLSCNSGFGGINAAILLAQQIEPWQHL